MEYKKIVETIEAEELNIKNRLANLETHVSKIFLSFRNKLNEVIPITVLCKKESIILFIENKKPFPINRNQEKVNNFKDLKILNKQPVTNTYITLASLQEKRIKKIKGTIDGKNISIVVERDFFRVSMLTKKLELQKNKEFKLFNFKIKIIEYLDQKEEYHKKNTIRQQTKKLNTNYSRKFNTKWDYQIEH